jgi:histidyl-tRNA synthetase
MKFNKVKGMEDFYPEDQSVKLQVFKVLRETAVRFGFQEVEAPALESASLLTAKSGDEIKEQLFVLEKRSTEELALRFDLTVPFTRMFVAKQRELAKGTKWFGLSRMWRYEAPQKGRAREFYQLSAELFGCDNAQAVAECINLQIACLKNLGLSADDVKVRANNRMLLEGMIKAVTGSEKFEEVTKVIDKIKKISEQAFVSELEKLGIDATKAAELRALTAMKGTPSQILDTLEKDLELNDTAKKGIADLRALVEFVPRDFFVLDLSIARGLAYYTGTVWEVIDTKGELRSIAGGGQYDGLTELLGGQNCPAVGFGMGYSTLKLLLEKRGKLPKANFEPEYYIAVVDQVVAPQAMALANRLREKYSVELDVAGRNLGKQMKLANQVGAKKLIVFGPDEAASGKVEVKDLSSGQISVHQLSDL